MRSSPRTLVGAALACAAAYAVLMVAAFVPAGGRWVDSTALGGLASLNGSATIHEVATWLSRTCDPVPFALACLALAAFALATRGPRRTAAVATLLIGANASSQILKPMSGLRDASASHIPEI